MLRTVRNHSFFCGCVIVIYTVLYMGFELTFVYLPFPCRLLPERERSFLNIHEKSWLMASPHKCMQTLAARPSSQQG